MTGPFNPNLTWWSKDGRWAWWARQFQRRENSSTTDALETSSGNNSMVVDDRRMNVSSALDDTPGSAEKEEIGATGGNTTIPSNHGDDNPDSGGEGDDEQSSGRADDNTPHAPASEIGEADDEEMTEGDEQITGEMKDMALDAGDMTYQCDDSLGGGPDPIDCEKLSWSGLKPPDSIETLQPNVPQFYTQGKSAFHGNFALA